MLWIGNVFQSSQAGLPRMPSPRRTAYTLACSGPNQKPCHKLNFELMNRTPADWGLELSSAFCSCRPAEINEKALPGRYGPEGLFISAGSESCLNAGEILPEELPYIVRRSLLQEVSRPRGWAGEKSAAEFGESWPSGN
jgi:hypothetical protein